MKTTKRPHAALLAAVLLAILQMLPAGAAPRQPWPPLPEIGRIHSERFDQPYWFGTNWVDPDVWMESWSGWALTREQSAVAPWVVPMVGASTNLQINPERGGFRVWYRPSWSSFSTGLGMGPGGLARLLTLVSSNESESVTYWALAINSTGDELELICEAEGAPGGGTGPTVCASASISFLAGEWHLLTVGYTETNSALFLDAEQVVFGSGVASVPMEAAGASALVIGSSLAGDEVAMGEFEEFTAFSGWNLLMRTGGHEFGLSEFWSIANYYSNRIGRAMLGPVGDEELTLTPGGGTRPTGMEEEFGGGMFAPLVLTGADCITNGPVLLTNVTASTTTNGAGEPVTQIGFNVIGGTNGPFSLYRSKDVSAPWISTNWLWIQYVSPCDAVWLTNEPPLMAYYRIGPEKDSDGDLMLDSWEILNHLDVMHNDAALDPDGDGLSNYGEFIAHTDPHNLDSDYDGVCDGEEVYAAHSTNPMDADEVAHILLGSWRFDSDLVGLQLQAPITSSNLALVPGISGNAVSVNSTNPAWLTYACSNDCVANINLRRGSARFWFKGAWNSGTADIGSAGSQPRLLEVGSKGSADGWFALILDSRGTNVSLCTPTDGAGGYRTNYTVGINWNSNQYHQIVATWSPTNSSLYLDGVLRTNAAGIATWPKSAARAGGFRIGSDIGGTNQAKGRFDNWETWNYELSAAEVSAGLSGCPPSVDVMLVIDRSSSMGQALDGSITKFEAAKEAATNFVGHLRLDPDQAGLVSFWSNTFMYQGLTTVRTSIITAITSLTDSNGTRMDYGITNAYAELTNQAHRNPASLGAMVLLTDGFNEGGTSNDVVTAADAVTNAGLKMIAIGLGPNPDTNLLKRIASTTNDFYWATNQSQLDQAYNSIANTLCRLTNLAPAVSITNPTNNQSFTYPASIRIEATASDPENGLVKVEFYAGTNGATLVGADYHAPFTVVWNGAAVGTNVLRAVAYDEYGLTSTDSVSVVVISVPPSVQFVSPTNGQLFVFSPTNISITATASVTGASITNLLIYHGATQLAQTNGPFCQVLWTNVSAGTNTLSAVATDSQNRSATNNITITNNALPTVVITTPTNFQGYQQVTNVTITATASDSDGTVTNVTFYSNSTFAAQGRLPGLPGSNSSVWSLAWTNPPNGTNFVTAVAVDNRGVSNFSTIRLFKTTPTNPPPTVAITFPASSAVFNAGANITIAATATNFPASVTNVEFFANGRLLGSDPSTPYSLTECCWKAGTYELVALASDNFGASAASAPVRITVEARVPGSGEGFWDPQFTLPDAIYEFGGLARYGSNLYCAVSGYGDSLYQWDGVSWTSWDAFTLDSHRILSIAANETGVYYADLDDHGLLVHRWDGEEAHLVAEDQGLACYGMNTWFRPVFLKFIGPDLYLGGDFVGAPPDTNINYLAKYNAASNVWEAVGNGLGGPPLALDSYQGELVVGGHFASAGTFTNVHNIVRLENGVWVPLDGGGVGGTNSVGNPGSIYSLAVCGSNLFVGGDFTTAGSVTNANGIALWNGHQWKSIGEGVAAIPEQVVDFGFPNPVVLNLAARGDTVFASGKFTAIWGEEAEYTPVSGIAKTVWSEEKQRWVWSDLDLGAFSENYAPGAYAGDLSAMEISKGETAGVYDVTVGGTMTFAGSGMTNLLGTAGPVYNGVARWRVGRSPAANVPALSLTAPTNHSVFTNNPASLTLTATNTNSVGIASVEFYADGNFIGTDSTSGTNLYTQDWADPPNGLHLLKAIATGTNGVRGESRPVLITLRGPGNVIAAHDDSFTLVQSSPAVALPVLTNDTPGTGLRVSRLLQLRGSLGTATISHDGKTIAYVPFPKLFGTDRFAYSVTNGNGDSDSAWVTVNLRARPVVQITNLFAGDRFGTNSNVNVSGLVRDYDGAVTNVTLLLDGASLTNQPASSVFSFNWSTNAPGFYSFVAVATDNDGLTNGSALITIAITNNSTATNVITATIENLSNNIIGSLTGLSSTNIPVIREGFFQLQGKARDSHAGETVTYQVLLYRPEDNTDPDAGQFAVSFANVTPGPRDASGFHVGGDNTNDLGVLDLSGVPNGRYDMLLIVHGGGGEATASVRFQLSSQLKIGQFSFSEQDLVLPVNGIPLTVTRTYNSLNPRSADFGYSWTYALNSMDVELDDVRQNVTIGSGEAPFADDEEDENGLPKVVSIRTGGGWDVTLNLPDGRRTTFAFTPFIGSFHAEAQWTAPPDVHATLHAYPSGSEVLEYFPSLYWQGGGENSTFDNHDIPGWVLETLDGTKYYITRGDANNVVWDSTGVGNFVNVQAYGPPKLTSIVQRNGDRIEITDGGIAHYNPTNGLTRSVLIDHDSQGRITAISDPISQLSATNSSQPFPSVRYVYNQDTGNLIQVLKLTNRSSGAYVTNKYHYDNPNFPHYITSLENPMGIPVARNEYDDDGRLTAVVDADDNRTEFIHSTSNRVERVIDRLHFTNTVAYDLRGNMTAMTNALNGIKLMAYDDLNNKTNEVAFMEGQPYATNRWVYDTNGLLLASYNPLGYSNVYTYNTKGQTLVSLRPCGCSGATNVFDDITGLLRSSSDALGNTTSYRYNTLSQLISSTDPLGTVTTNVYDGSGNLLSTAVLAIDQSGLPPVTTVTILSTNSFDYDLDGSRKGSVVWRRVGINWAGATNTYIRDARNRIVQSIDPLGFTNAVVLDEVGKPTQTINKLGRTTAFQFDELGRPVVLVYPDGLYETSYFDANGRLTNSVDRGGGSTVVIYDALGRRIRTIFPDQTTNSTVYDDLGRVRFTVDARGTTNAFGYDRAGHRIAATNAWGIPSLSTFTLSQYDANGNQFMVTDALGRSTTNVFDPLNRVIEVDYSDGTKVQMAYDAAGRRITETNQEGNVACFCYDGLGQLAAVTNAAGTPGYTVTRFERDETGAVLAQIDALNRTNRFAYDALGRRVSHTMPDTNLVERFGYDAEANLLSYTNFAGIILANEYDEFNRPTNRASANGYEVRWTYTILGQRETMTDASGAYAYVYDVRGRLRTNATPAGAIRYSYDANGNLTNVTSSTPNGTFVTYERDALNRITNVIDARLSGPQNTSYGFDTVGNLRTYAYPNGVTNLYERDLLNRLTNLTWKSAGSPRADFAYTLSPGGKRTALSETNNSGTRNFAWQYDVLSRLTNEAVTGAIPTGHLAYALDVVGNRTNRDGSLGSLGSQAFTYNANDWPTVESYDANGNMVTNAAGQPYFYDPENRLTNFNNGQVTIVYNGDGQRIKKVAGGVTTLYLVDVLNPSGYAQVLEELTVGSTTNLARAYTYGLDLISQRETNGVTYYFGYDAHGSTRFLLDGSGTVSQAFAYDAYGTLIASNGVPATVYLYCGEQFDPDLGVYYFRERLMNPATGRFLTEDPFGGSEKAPISLHKYLYANASPINWIDPSGRVGEDVDPYLPDLGVHLSSIPVTGKCGPDVTDAVAKTLAEVETTFSDDHNPKYLPPDTPDMHRYSACQALYAPVAGVGGSGTAWDIRPLITLGNRNIPRDLPTGLESADFPVAGTCGGTVVYQGLCRWASAVNYALWGKANRLCHDKFGNRPFTIQTGNPLKPTWTVSWSLLDTQAAVIWRKMSQSVGGYFGNSEAQWAEIFAIGGYCGTSYPIQTDEIITCGTKGVKKWPNAPMVWQWSGVHDPY